MTKRAPFDLNALTAEPAVPMQKLVPARVLVPTSAPPVSAPVAAPAVASVEAKARKPTKPLAVSPPTATANLEALQFKVSTAFSKRFRRAAFEHELKLNELLFEAFAAWEARQTR